MKKLFVFCFTLLLVFISCDNKNPKKIENSATANLIKIGFYPANAGQPAETILNLKEKYLVFYSPEAYYHEIPPPSETGQVKTYNELISENPKLIPFRAEMTEILSGKAEDRRELFDEAAGITKYKRRKTKF